MKANYDFTQGNIWRQLVYFSMPIMLTNLLQVSYQFIDSLWVGMGASFIISSIVAYLYYRFGGWQRKKIIFLGIEITCSDME